MTRNPEEIDQAFDTQEQRCIAASKRFESARTPIGRFFARIRLEGERQELEQITDEHDIVMLHGRGPEASEGPQ